MLSEETKRQMRESGWTDADIDRMSRRTSSFVHRLAQEKIKAHKLDVTVDEWVRRSAAMSAKNG